MAWKLQHKDGYVIIERDGEQPLAVQVEPTTQIVVTAPGQPLAVRVIQPEPEKPAEPSQPLSNYEYPLTTARTVWTLLNEVQPGDFILAHTDGTLEGITLKLGMQPRDDSADFRTWRLRYQNAISYPFKYAWLQSTAQPSKTLFLTVGRGFKAGSQTNEVTNDLSGVLDSTTTVLGDGLTYTGSAFHVAGYGVIVVTVYADRAGTLYVDQSGDGTNYDEITVIAYTAAATNGHSVEVVGITARLRFTNAAGAAQTSFRLYARTRRI